MKYDHFCPQHPNFIHAIVPVGKYIVSSNCVYQDQCFSLISVAHLTGASWKEGVSGRERRLILGQILLDTSKTIGKECKIFTFLKAGPYSWLHLCNHDNPAGISIMISILEKWSVRLRDVKRHFRRTQQRQLLPSEWNASHICIWPLGQPLFSLAVVGNSVSGC